MVFDFSDDFFRERFANVQISVMGERSLIEKLLPAIRIREAWLEREMLPEDLFHDKSLEPWCMEVVAYGALYDSFPQLDVVLTPNGLATVGNNTLTPASAARSEAARKSMAALLFQAQESLLERLRRNERWLKSAWASVFRRSLIVSLADSCALDPNRTADSFELAKAMGLKAAIEEDRFARRYISHELMSLLREKNIAGSLSQDELHVVERLRDAVKVSLVNGGKPGEILVDIVDFIRRNPLSFPVWHRSRTAEALKDHRFVNDRRSGGFFL